MALFNDPTFLRSIIIDHYDKPRNLITNNKEVSDYTVLHTKLSSCADDFYVYIKKENNKILDIKYLGMGCAISTAAGSIISEELKNKTIDEAKIFLKNYFFMIKNQKYNETILKEANAFCTIYKQLNRIKCSTLIANMINDFINQSE